ncbi:MAG: hypothetical protein Q9171_001052 [Xanthocarpia ochracea]
MAMSATVVWNVVKICVECLVGWYLATSIWAAIYNLFFHPLASYPGNPFSLKHHGRRLRVDIHDFTGPVLRAAFYFPDAISILSGRAYLDTRRLHEKYGNVVRTSPSALSYNTAQGWKDIYALKSDRSELAKDPNFYEPGPNILSANQSDHTRMRRLYAHAFTDTALLEQSPLLTRYFDLLVSKLKQKIDGPEQGRVDLMAYYNFTTFDIIGDLTLGEPFGALETGEYHSFIKNIMVLQHNDERGMTRDEIIGTSRVMLIAGSETTATLLGGATYHLLQNPSVIRRAQLEIRGTFRNADDITLRAVSTPGLLPYLEAVLQESLRCHPPVPATLPRKVGSSGAVVGGKFVPANVCEELILQFISKPRVHQWSTYRSSANFASPDTFDPERFLPSPPEKYCDDNAAALQPFLMGPRGCIGKARFAVRLAYFEMRSILARMLWHFEIQLDEVSQHWTEQNEYALWDKPPLWVRLQHRVQQ